MDVLSKTGSAQRLAALVSHRPAALSQWFAVEELAAALVQKNAAPSLAARWLAKLCLLSQLRPLSPLLPSTLRARDIVITNNASGRPVVMLPAAVVAVLHEQQLGVDVSLSHANQQVMAVTILAAQQTAQDIATKTIRENADQ